MPDKLFSENMRLRAQLSELIEQARINQQIMHRHQMLDLQFIGASSFSELLERLFHTFTRSSELELVTLALFDPDYDIRRILVELELDLGRYANLFFVQSVEELGELGRTHGKAVLGRYEEQRHGTLFPEPLDTPASVAIVPLRRQDVTIGYLGLGSADTHRFQPDMATDFIQHRASVVALCIENVLNRERLRHIGLTDSLTQVSNRRYIERRLFEEIVRSRRSASALSCLYIDIDRFKQINDTHGHQTGDQVLRGVAARIKAELRLNDALGRFGGEEFIALLADTDADDASGVAERIRAGVAETPLELLDGAEIAVTVSIGIAATRELADTADPEILAGDVVARADQALYRAKTSGRNRVMRSE